MKPVQMRRIEFIIENGVLSFMEEEIDPYTGIVNTVHRDTATKEKIIRDALIELDHIPTRE